MTQRTSLSLRSGALARNLLLVACLAALPAANISSIPIISDQFIPYAEAQSKPPPPPKRAAPQKATPPKGKPSPKKAAPPKAAPQKPKPIGQNPQGKSPPAATKSKTITKPLGTAGSKSRPASSSFSKSQLSQHLKLLEKDGVAGYRELENGRLRYLGELRPSRLPGRTAGQRTVKEWDPKTGQTRTWMENLDHRGKVIRIRPQQNGRKIHYEFDSSGNYVAKW